VLTNFELTKDEKEYVLEHNNLQINVAKQEGVGGRRGNFHPKVWIIEFVNFARICISSSNLYIYDLTFWSNNFWLSDFPLKIDGDSAEPTEREKDFRDYFTNFYEIMHKGVKFDKMFELSKYDLTKQLRKDKEQTLPYLVASVQGIHKESDKYKYGFHRLAEIMKNNPFNCKDYKSKRITYQTSSLGSINGGLIIDLFSKIFD